MAKLFVCGKVLAGQVLPHGVGVARLFLFSSWCGCGQVLCLGVARYVGVARCGCGQVLCLGVARFFCFFMV